MSVSFLVPLGSLCLFSELLLFLCSLPSPTAQCAAMHGLEVWPKKNKPKSLSWPYLQEGSRLTLNSEKLKYSTKLLLPRGGFAAMTACCFLQCMIQQIRWRQSHGTVFGHYCLLLLPLTCPTGFKSKMSFIPENKSPDRPVVLPGAYVTAPYPGERGRAWLQL